MKRILVTGSSGYIGKNQMKALLDAGYEAFGIDMKEGMPLELPDPFTHIPPCDAVIHLAAYISNPDSFLDPLKYYENNIVSTLAVLSAMKAKGIKRLIFASSAAVYGEIPSGIEYVKEDFETEPQSPYGKSKYFCEQIIKDVCKNLGIEYFIMRFFNVAGNNNPHLEALIPRVIDCLEKGDQFSLFGDRHTIRDFIHVEDVCLANILALESDQKNLSLNIASGRGNSIIDIIRKCESIVGRNLIVLESKKREGDIPMIIANETLAQESIGFIATKSIDNIIASEWKAKYSSIRGES